MSALEHFYSGMEWNPRPLHGVDLKMWCYLVGAVGLCLNVLSAMALHLQVQGDTGPSRAAVAYLIMIMWFATEYMWFERVHLYTYDLFRERLGFKIVWGCFCFYPFFYCVGVWPLVDPAGYTNGDISQQAARLIVALYAGGWVLTRGANLQKYALKRGRKTFLGMQLITVPGSNGRLLCSGWWGISRHVNYLGEIVQGIALALPGWLATGSLVPWLYPAYYLVLFIPRQLDDDVVCAAKYGEAWARYTALVKYRIMPYVG